MFIILTATNTGINSRHIRSWNLTENGWYVFFADGSGVEITEPEDVKAFTEFVRVCNFFDANGRYIHT